MSHPLFGFLFALTAVVMWSLLPIILQPILAIMNAQTIVWYRFVTATIGVMLFLLFYRKSFTLRQINRQQAVFFLLGMIGLAGNFFFFNLALRYIPTSASQVLSPLSSFLMLMVGVLVFKERVGIHQKIGFILLLLGFGLFFNDRFDDFSQFNDFAWGILLACLASVIWLLYSVAQKMLLKHYSVAEILFFIYLGCSFLISPVAAPMQIVQLDATMLGFLIFCCVNTLIAYGCYAQALRYWKLTKVSVMMTQIPILTICFAHLASGINPVLFQPPQLNSASYFGAVIVVLGALISVLGHRLLSHKSTRNT